MSSNNIVIDNRSKALIIANGEECRIEILNDILSWNPFVLALDGAANRLHTLGVNLDGVLGDFDSLTNRRLLESEQHPIEFFERPDQNKTDLEKGIELLIEKGYSEVWILWATGKRLDHTLANAFCIAKYAKQINCNLIDNHSSLYTIHSEFSKWYEQGQILSLIPVGTCSGVTTNNLKYTLEDESLFLPDRLGTSNEVSTDGTVKISLKEGLLLLIESK